MSRYMDPIKRKEQEERKALRRKICSDCDKNKKGFCTECGCVIILKTMFKWTECPLKKW
tara:strand:+ start:398 stop:574 length:177 start_codon:yes stop_codon:yes gene_type:complete